MTVSPISLHHSYICITIIQSGIGSRDIIVQKLIPVCIKLIRSKIKKILNGVVANGVIRWGIRVN